MKLDLRLPTLVITGHWNPAIFDWRWVAKNILEIPENTQVRLASLVAEPEGKIITYIDGFGYSAEVNRFEAFTQSHNGDSISHLSKNILKLRDILPHTPLHGLGVNFQFIDTSLEETIVDKVSNSDNLDLEVIAQERRTLFKYEPGISLRFKRVISDESAVLDFNFHHSRERFFSFESDENLKNHIEGLLRFSQRISCENYDVECEGELSHDFEEEVTE